MNRRAIILIICLFAAALAPETHAVRIGDLSESSFREQVIRFFTFRDPALRYALIGSILLGINCGLLGGFLVVRKMALVSERRVMVALLSVDPRRPVKALMSRMTAPSGRVTLATDSAISKSQKLPVAFQ